MRYQKCESCSNEVPLGASFRINGQKYCHDCADKTINQLSAMAAPIDAEQVIDPTLCVHCGADGGTTEFALIHNLPYCPACHAKAYNWPFPLWLRIGFAVLVLALGAALVHGAKFFTAGRALFRGERLIAQHKSADAVPLLRQSVQIAPQCEKCALLLGRALLLSGQVVEADKVLSGHNGGRYEDTEAVNEVNAIMSRASSAYEKAAEAKKLFDSRKYDEALRLLREANALYPEDTGFEADIQSIQVAAVWDRKDYDGFLSIAKHGYAAHPDDPAYVGQYSSALACKYASTGDEDYRRQAEEMLTKTRTLVSTPEQREWFGEYEERLQHRLRTREIIDKEEYDRRFRKDANNAGGQQ